MKTIKIEGIDYNLVPVKKEIEKEIGVWKYENTNSYVVDSKTGCYYVASESALDKAEHGYWERETYTKITDLTEIKALLKQRDRMLDGYFEVVKWSPKVGEELYFMSVDFTVCSFIVPSEFPKGLLNTFPNEQLCQQFCDKVKKLREEM